MNANAPAPGFTADTWKTVATFSERLAHQADVDAHAAVFALTDTLNAAVFEEPLPQPVIWYDDEAEEEFAALIIQAESHEAEDGQELQVLGLLLPGGRTAIAFTEDVEEVAGDNADWLGLLAADLSPQDDEENA